jgi:hypothetical protein
MLNYIKSLILRGEASLSPPPQLDETLLLVLEIRNLLRTVKARTAPLVRMPPVGL